MGLETVGCVEVCSCVCVHVCVSVCVFRHVNNIMIPRIPQRFLSFLAREKREKFT